MTCDGDLTCVNVNGGRSDELLGVRPGAVEVCMGVPCVGGVYGALCSSGLEMQLWRGGGKGMERCGWDAGWLGG